MLRLTAAGSNKNPIASSYLFEYEMLIFELSRPMIPDFIPVLGHLDDIILVPMGIWLMVKLLPEDVWAECEAEVARRNEEKPTKDWRGILVVVAIWLVLLLLGIWASYQLFWPCRLERVF